MALSISRWVDEDLNPREELIFLHLVQNICADAVVVCICHALIRTNLKLKNCRGQSYDSASNTSGEKSGLSTQIKAEKPNAILIHCYEHSVQLTIGDMIKETQNMKDALDTSSEISKLLEH